MKALIGVAVVLGTAAVVGAGVLPSSPSSGGGKAREAEAPPKVVRRDVAPFLAKGIDWLAKAQHPDGGWGGGSHGNQQNRDPHAVPTDPATTSFSALALIRAGHTPTSGTYANHVAKALEYVVGAVEKSGDGPRVTALEGTQPQTKMGPLVDTALAVQFLSRVAPLLPKKHALYDRTQAALDKALGKLQASQTKEGEWGGGGWANSLQGSLGTVALEMAQSAGKEVSKEVLAKARATQQSRLDAKTGAVDATGSAGVGLYAWAGAGRNSAQQYDQATRLVRAAKEDKKLPADAEVTVDNLKIAGAAAPDAAMLAEGYEVAKAQTKSLDDERMLQGFGNNGGEEFLSYMMTSEALVIGGGDEWAKWSDRMFGLAQKAQSADGSWTGHHCITSPVFCTAAVIQALTADFDADVLRAKAPGSKFEKSR